MQCHCAFRTCPGEKHCTNNFFLIQYNYAFFFSLVSIIFSEPTVVGLLLHLSCSQTWNTSISNRACEQARPEAGEQEKPLLKRLLLVFFATSVFSQPTKTLVRELKEIVTELSREAKINLVWEYPGPMCFANEGS